jgi:competence protein ComEC
LALLGILAYCVITGFEAPIVRAAIMAAIGYLAQLTGRVGNSVRSVGITGLIMAAIKPSWVTDIGFILSFASTISLMLFEIKISSKLGFVPGIFRESLSTSLAAQIGTAPILFAAFGQFNILSPIINALEE